VTVPHGVVTRSPGRGPAPIERVATTDLSNLVGGVPAPWHMAAVLRLRGPTLDLGAVREAVAARVVAVPRLRQRLHRVPFGCGRPIWVDDAAFDVRRHVHAIRCPPPGDERSLLDLVAHTVAQPLAGDRPLWRMVHVTGLDDGRDAVVVVLHHVLADGIGGLAVLGALVDGVEPTAETSFPRPAPTRSALRRDVGQRAIRAPGRLLGTLPGLAAARHELGRPTLAPASSLNRPTGSQRRYAVVRAPLPAIQAVAHATASTVNDVVLAGVAGALQHVLAERGEHPDRLIASVPISGRRTTTVDELGNAIGTMPVELPLWLHDRRQRLRRIAAATRRRKGQQRGSSAGLVQPLVRFLSLLGVWRWLIERQRLVNTFVTNLRGPPQPLRFLGAEVDDVVALGLVAGNVAVGFTVLSYAGNLTIAVVVDPEVVGDPQPLADALDAELVRLHASLVADTTT
jgi:diacylglycerol O-acyltransferase / wax synthase